MTYQIVWGILTALSLAGFIASLIVASVYDLIFTITACCLIITLYEFIFSFRMVVQQYKYKDTEILIYGFFFKCYVKKDGEIVNKQWRSGYWYNYNNFAFKVDKDTALHISIDYFRKIKINTV